MIQIWNFAIGITTALVLIIGLLGVLIGCIYLIVYLVFFIIKRLGLARPLFEFCFEYFKKKNQNK